MWTALPDELKQRPQWMCARDDKKPISPRTKSSGWKDPGNWVTFEEACAAGYPHIGFVVTKDSGLAVIDLDVKGTPGEPQQALHDSIVNEADSYTEWSVGGRGRHVILKGSVAEGVNSRDNAVEIYSDHFILCTGKVARQAPIRDGQALLDDLYGRMKPETPGPALLVERDSPFTDQEVFDLAMKGHGEKFDLLCKGEWEALDYPSQSEADQALVGILGHYSPSDAQVKELFWMSALGKREKAHRPDYLERCLAKVRANEPPRVEATGLLARTKKPTGLLVPWDVFMVPRQGALELVKDVLGEGAHSTTFGESGSGKTFLTLELAVRVALGQPFAGRQTKQSPVVLFVGEGALGMQKRVAALSTLLGGQTPPILFFPYSLDVPEGIEEVLRLVEEATATFGRPPGLVIFDTVVSTLRQDSAAGRNRAS